MLPHLPQITDLLKKHNLDALLLYNGIKEEPSLLTSLLEDEVFDSMMLLIHVSGEYTFFVAGRHAEIAKKRYEQPFMGTKTKVDMLDEVISELKWARKLGIAGRVSYRESKKLKKLGIELLLLDDPLLAMYTRKTPTQVRKLRDIRAITEEIFNQALPTVGISEKDFEKQFRDAVPEGYKMEFLYVTGYEQLSTSTLDHPTDRRIQDGDTLCVDFGLSYGGYHSDMTRCYTVGEDNPLADPYARIQQTIEQSLQHIRPGVKNQDYIRHLQTLSEKNGLPGYILVDLGHGIGNDLHEYPDMYNDTFVFTEGMCFTIEPEYRIGDKLLRYEDVYTIANGKCVCIKDIKG